MVAVPVLCPEGSGIVLRFFGRVSRVGNCVGDAASLHVGGCLDGFKGCRVGHVERPASSPESIKTVLSLFKQGRGRDRSSERSKHC